MGEFGPSGIAGLPGLTLDSRGVHGDPRVLGWIREAIQEGDRINMSDPGYGRMETGMQYVSGNQTVAGRNTPAYAHPDLITNQCRSAMQGHVSALTDLKPLFAYKSMKPEGTLAADVLNKLTVAWWVNTMADIELGHCIKFALAAGTGDLVTEWDPYSGWGGEVRLSARDARDTLPIRPAQHDRSIQAWEGCVIRESHTVNVMKGLYPEFSEAFKATTDSLLATLMGRFRSFSAKVISPAADTLSGLNQAAVSNRTKSGEIILYRTYLTDRSTNLTSKPIPMGRPGAAWTYLVPPGGRLYPYKRLIVSTPEMVLYDGPNTYWHGQYPLSRLKLWDLPWHFLGVGLFNDLIPLQDAMNRSFQDIFLGLDKWLNPSVTYNRGAVSENTMRLFDPRRPGSKIKLTDAGMKEGFKINDGPPAQVLALAAQMYTLASDKFNELSGTPNLQQLLALRQLPGAETIQKYWEAMTPELRQEGRAIESFLRDVAEQHKVMRFQFESNSKRVTILGDAASLLEDFDFDPETLVPSMDPAQDNYNPDYDRSLPRDVRAQAFHRSIVFTITPNSILSMNATEGKMMKLQLARAGMYDFWSLAEALEIANVGSPPPMPLPPLNPEAALAEINQMVAEGRQQEVLQKYVPDPITGQWLEIRSPMTVTERLIAQSQLGIGMTENPAGRKASGQAAPKQETKSDGRTTVTESNHDAG